MRKSTIFFLSCLAFILGIGAHSWLWPQKTITSPFALYIIFLLLLVAALTDFIQHLLNIAYCEDKWSNAVFPRSTLRQEGAGFIFFRNRKILAALLGACFFILGLWRFAVSMPIINNEHIAYYNGQELALTGVVDDEPEIRDNNSRYTIANAKLKSQNAKLSPYGGSPEGRQKIQNLDGGLLLVTKSFPEYKYGDKLEMNCKLEKPELVEDFDYPAYLARDNIYSLCYYPKEIKVIAENQASFLRAGLYGVKNKFVSVVNHLLPEPQASFLGGLLYGARQSIPPDLTEAFKRTGTSHLIAVSGYNISIVAGFIVSLLSWLWIPRRAAFPLAVAAIIGFVMLTGAGASVVRAGVMGLIVLLAKNIGRLSSVRNILSLAAALMLLQNPKILAFDLGFQLSFAATIGLVVLSPYFSEKFKKMPSQFGLREAASATFSAIIFTLPILLYNFGALSFVAPVANLMVVPFIPLTMSMGFVAALSGLIYLSLGAIAGWLVWVPLAYEISVIKFLSKFPIMERKISLWLFLLMYGIIIAWALKCKIKSAKCKMTIKNSPLPFAKGEIKRNLIN